MALHRLLDEIQVELLKIPQFPYRVESRKSLVVVDPQGNRFAVSFTQLFQPHEVEFMRCEPGLQFEDSDAVAVDCGNVFKIRFEIRIGDREAQGNGVAASSSDKFRHA